MKKLLVLLFFWTLPEIGYSQMNDLDNAYVVQGGAAVADFAVTAGGALGVQAGILAANVYATAYECYVSN
ncbi:MAG: hypothetical protein ACQESK_00130 [Bacteroidota bacterium]